LTIIYPQGGDSKVDTAIGVDTIAPNAVTITVVNTSTIGQITINWTAASYSGALGGDVLAGYNIFRASESQLLNRYHKTTLRQPFT